MDKGPLEKRVTKLYEGNVMASDAGIALINEEVSGPLTIEERLSYLDGACTGLLKGLQLLARELERLDPEGTKEAQPDE
jgi:hypothetical protein